MKLLQGLEEEPNEIQRRINKLRTLQEKREEVYNSNQQSQNRIKKTFDKVKEENFQIQDVVLKWEARIEEKGKHGKFENIWKGPFKVAAFHGNNTYILQEMDGQPCAGGPVNGRFLKH